MRNKRGGLDVSTRERRPGQSDELPTSCPAGRTPGTGLQPKNVVWSSGVLELGTCLLLQC